MKNVYTLACEENPHVTLEEIREDVKVNLEEFDKYWVTFEQLYVFELMLIEADARRFVTDAIEIEKEMTEIEKQENRRGTMFMDSAKYNEVRKKLIKMIGKINSVSNFNSEGHGRDDFKLDMLVTAEKLVRRISKTQSKAVRSMADNVKRVFKEMRALFKKYAQNIEIVDPQLRNNPDLVDALLKFEKRWEKASIYFTDSKKCN